MDNFTPTLFDILKLVNEDANEKEIKEAYRKLIKEYHPDINSDRKEWAEEMTKKLNEAYEILSNPQKREEYIQHLKDQRLKLKRLIWEEQQEKFRREELRQQQLIIRQNVLAKREKEKRQQEMIETGFKVVGGTLAVFAFVELIKHLGK